jgi:hypothetical protein
MGLFKKRPPKPFWLRPPFDSHDPDVLYQGGILAVGRDDGVAMTAIGWRLWDLVGLHSHQSFDLLTDGYRAWQNSPHANPEEAAAFLVEMLGRLSGNPSFPPDIYAAPPELVQPAATHYGARAWAAAELWPSAGRPGCPSEEQLYHAIATCPAPFVPPRSMALARDFAARHGLGEPFAH